MALQPNADEEQQPLSPNANDTTQNINITREPSNPTDVNVITQPQSDPNPSNPSQTTEYHSLRKQNTIKQVEINPSITNITCGISWDFFDQKVDLDVTCVALDTYSFEMDAAYYNQTNILDGSIIHSGDNHDGVGDGDDEQIRIDLNKLPQRCKSLWFIVNAFSGGDFSGVETARFTLYNGSDHNQILYSYGIGMAFNSTALLLGVLSVNDTNSDNKQWSFKVCTII